MNFSKIIELMRGFDVVSEEDLKQALTNILSSNLYLNTIDVVIFQGLLLQKFKNLHELIESDSPDSEIDSDSYKILMIENLSKFWLSMNLDSLQLNSELTNDQDWAVLFFGVMQDLRDTTNHVSEAFNEVSTKIVCHVSPTFKNREQERIMRLLVDPISAEIPETPYLYESVSVRTSNYGNSLMLDKTTMDGMLRGYQKSRDNLKTIDEQPLSLSFILYHKLSESEPSSLDQVLDGLLYQFDQQLPNVLSEDMYNMYWQQLKQLDHAIEDFIVNIYSEISRELQKYTQILERRIELENLDEQLMFQIGQEQEEDYLLSLILQHEDFVERLNQLPSRDYLSGEIERLQSLLSYEDDLLDIIILHQNSALTELPNIKELNYDQHKILFREVIHRLKDRGWRISDDNEGLLYSHYQRRYDEQTGFYDEQKGSLVVASHGAIHELKGCELKHPLDSNSFLQNPVRCDEFRDLLIACAINGDIEAFRRRQYIRRAIFSGEYNQSSEIAQQLEFFEKIDEFLSSKEDYYLECLKSMYVHFLCDNNKFEELVKTRTESQARFLSDLMEMISPAITERPFFKLIYNNLDRDSDEDYNDYDCGQESKGPRF